jgi:hypothetical protein
MSSRFGRCRAWHDQTVPKSQADHYSEHFARNPVNFEIMRQKVETDFIWAVDFRSMAYERRWIFHTQTQIDERVTGIIFFLF